MSSLRGGPDRGLRRCTIGIAASVLAFAPAVGMAQDRSPRESDKPRAIPNYHILTDTPRRNTDLQNFHFFVRVMGGDRLLWAGDLFLAEYDGASFETDLQDINPNCGFYERRRSSRASALVLSLSPTDLSEGYRFRLKTYWNHRLPKCDELRSDIVWINVPVEIDEGETKTVAGDGGLSVELTRKPWAE